MRVFDAIIAIGDILDLGSDESGEHTPRFITVTGQERPEIRRRYSVRPPTSVSFAG